jgi:hypothetical protein
MSSREILEELPKLSPEDRKRIVHRALELNWTEAEREAVEFAEACALEAFQMMDRLEAEAETKDASRRSLDS